MGGGGGGKEREGSKLGNIYAQGTVTQLCHTHPPCIYAEIMVGKVIVEIDERTGSTKKQGRE